MVPVRPHRFERKPVPTVSMFRTAQMVDKGVAERADQIASELARHQPMRLTAQFQADLLGKVFGVVPADAVLTHEPAQGELQNPFGPLGQTDPCDPASVPAGLRLYKDNNPGPGDSSNGRFVCRTLQPRLKFRISIVPSLP